MTLRASSLAALFLINLALIFLATHPLLAEPTSRFPRPTNAALVYWPAFAAMPEPTDEENALFKTIGRYATIENAPIDKAAATVFVEKFTSKLDAVDRALLISKCDWELDYSLGAYLPLPHLGKALTTAKILALRARLRIVEGKPDAALEDLHRVLKVSRHAFQNDKMLLAALVQVSLESMIFHTAAADLSKFDRKSLDTLLTILDTLPPRMKMTEAIEGDSKLMIAWYHAQTDSIERLPSKQERGERESNQVDPREVLSLIFNRNGLGAVKQAIHTLECDLAHFSKLANLPYREAEMKTTAFLKEIAKRKNEALLSAITLPNFGSVLAKEKQEEMHCSMLRAAIAIRLHGVEAVATVKDPLTDVPFIYKDLKDEGGGFELTSKEKVNEKPVSLIFR